MAHRHTAFTALACAIALGLPLTGAPAGTQELTTAPPLTVASGRVSIEGTSNIHAYTATTTAVRVTGARFARDIAGPAFWDEVMKPGALEGFEIAIPARTLSSPKEGLDKNMHKALKVAQHPEITFRLLRLEGDPAGALKAIGLLRIAGVEREVAFDLGARPTDAGLAVTGEVQLLMTDYGITPPKAMLGMLKTDPKVTVRFDVVLAVSST